MLKQFTKSLLRAFNVSVVFSPFDDQEHSCTRKVKYGHSGTAEKAVREMRAKGSKPLESYKCDYCSGYHIGGSF